MAAAAIPYIGWAIAAIALISAMSKSGGPKQDGKVGTTYTGIGATDNSLAGGLAPVVQGWEAQYKALTKQFGGTASVGLGLSISRDPMGDSNTFLEVAGTKDGKQVFSNLNRNVGRSDEDLQNAMATATVDAMLGALKASNLAQPFADYFDKISADLSVEAKQAAISTAQSVKGLTDALRGLAVPMGDFADMSVEARAGIASLVGGAEQFLSLTKSFEQNYYTQAERDNALWRDLVARFKDMGVVLPSTNEGFRKLVESTNKTSPLYASLLSLESAFASLYPAIDATAAKAARQSTLLDDMDKAAGSLRVAYEREASALQGAIDKHHEYAQELRQFRDGLRVGSSAPADPQERFAEAQRQFEAILAKAQAPINEDDPAAVKERDGARQALQGATDAFLENLQASSTTAVQYAVGFAKVQAALTLTANSADASADVARLQLDALQTQVGALIDINTSVLSVRDAVIAFLASQREAAAAGAVKLDDSLKNGVTLPSGYVGPGRIADLIGEGDQLETIIDLFRENLGRSPDAGAYDFYLNEFKSGKTAAQIEAQLKASDEYKRINGFAVGGLHEGGFFMAGENGPELIRTGGPARIWNASDTVDMLNRATDTGQSADIKALNVHQAETKVLLRALVEHAASTSRALNELAQRGIPINVEATRLPLPIQSI